MGSGSPKLRKRSSRIILGVALALGVVSGAPASAHALTYDGPVCVQVNSYPDSCTSDTYVHTTTGRNACSPYDLVCRVNAIDNGTSVVIGRTPAP